MAVAPAVPATSSDSRRNRASSPWDRRRRRLYLPFLVPALLLHVVFVMGPTVAAAWISLHRWSGIGPMEWVAFRNYEVLVTDPTFRTAFVNTMLILVAVGGVVFIVSFVLTMLIRDMRSRGFVRAVLFFPHIVSAIVLSIAWGFIFQYDGVVNRVLDALFRAEPVAWLSADKLLLMVSLGIVWLSTGLYVTIILAGVDRIPPYFYEDSAIAGASAYQRLRNVTLPLAADVISVAAIFWTINSLKMFEFIYAFGGTTSDLPPTSVWNSALFVYGKTFGGRSPSYQFGYASASMVMMLILFAVLVVLLRRIMRREAVEY